MDNLKNRWRPASWVFAEEQRSSTESRWRITAKGIAVVDGEADLPEDS